MKANASAISKRSQHQLPAGVRTPTAPSFRRRRNATRLTGVSLLLPGLMLAWISLGTSQAQAPAAAADDSSTAEQAKQVANPLTNIWMLQFQQNDNWIAMPLGKDSRTQHDLLFQPIVPLQLNDDWSLVSRPIFQLANSVPYVGLTGKDQRTTGFGDTVLAMALAPTKKLVGNWLIGAGPTFIFPTASDALLGQKEWQMGPAAVLGYSGKDFLTFVFAQQWFSVAGWGKTTSHMSALYSFVHIFENGWTIGTQEQFSVDWEARRGERVTFPVGLQVGKLVKVGRLPVKIDLQASYYPVSPASYGPNWGIQLQITPIIPTLIKGKLFASSSGSSTSSSAEVPGYQK